MEDNQSWYINAIFYQVYVRAFCDSNGDGHGDLQGLISKLDYIQDLGVDCIWLMPIYPSPQRDDGYDIADFTSVLGTYGTLADFKQLIDGAHTRGLRVVTDLVLNHTSDEHPWFQAARTDRQSTFRDYYVWSDTDQKFRDARIIFIDSQKSNWTWDEKAGQFFWHRFYPTQPDLNYDNPAVRAEMQAVMRFWLDLGIDGFRADAIPYLFEREGTNCENLPQTHAFLKTVRALLDSEYPGRILLGEANQWPEDVRPYFADGNELHMNFHFPLMPRLYLALHDQNVEPIKWVFERTPAIPENCQWCTFLRNHDELTLEMVTPEERDALWQAYAPDTKMRLNLGIRRRLAPLLDNDMRRIRLMNALLYSLPGTPILYYGDEIGMGDNIELFDRNGVRTPMQWDETRSAGFSTAKPEQFYAPLIDKTPYDFRTVNVVQQDVDPDSLLNFMRMLIRHRKAHPELASGTMEWVETDNPAVAAFTRRLGSKGVLAIFNLSDTSRGARIPRELRQEPRTDQLGSYLRLLPEQTNVNLKPYQFAWFNL
ncbi:MAG TPA: maltose alpha-D-glucosyltransferase [Bellilinea sp.]